MNEFKRTFHQIKLSIWRRIRCSKGEHWPGSASNPQANYCEACGALIRPEAYKDYRVTLADGDFQDVSAVNPHHAKSLVCYGNSSTIDGRTGKVLGKVLVHPENIKKVELISDIENAD